MTGDVCAAISQSLKVLKRLSISAPTSVSVEGLTQMATSGAMLLEEFDYSNTNSACSVEPDAWLTMFTAGFPKLRRTILSDHGLSKDALNSIASVRPEVKVVQGGLFLF